MARHGCEDGDGGACAVCSQSTPFPNLKTKLHGLQTRGHRLWGPMLGKYSLEPAGRTQSRLWPRTDWKKILPPRFPEGTFLFLCLRTIHSYVKCKWSNTT